MKIKQIVGEHKKGVRAMKYAKKPQNTIAPKKPVKPEAVMETDVKIEPMPGASRVVTGTGDVVGTATDSAAAQNLVKDIEAGKIIPTKDDGTGGSANPGQMGTNEEGVGESQMSEVDALFNDWMNSEYAPFDSDSGDYEIVARKARQFLRGQVADKHLDDVTDLLAQHFDSGGDWSNESYIGADASGDIGGDPTDRFIQDVSTDDVEEGFMDTVSKIGTAIGLDTEENLLKMSPQLQQLMALRNSPDYQSPEARKDLELRIQNHMTRLRNGGGEVMGVNGKPKEVKEIQSAVYPSRNDPNKAAQAAATQPGTQSAVYPSRNVVKESVELDRIRFLSGLK
jgi:hypothetical protein